MIESSEHSQEIETQSSPESSNNNDFSRQSSNQDMADAIAELDKMEKFKFQGQEWSPKDLEKAILRQKDYTQKTQSLAEERKQIETQKAETKFYENLYYDLNAVKQNPQLVSEFLRTYPEKFHSYLRDVLQNDQTKPNENKQQSSPQVDFETASRLQKLESVLFEQEVAKNAQVIESRISDLTKKYPDALPEMAIARVYEAANAGKKVTDADWEKAFQQVDTQIKNLVKTRYGDLVKKQSETNKRSRDVESGGGTPGRAPEKFKSLKDVTAFAIQDMTRK